MTSDFLTDFDLLMYNHLNHALPLNTTVIYYNITPHGYFEIYDGNRAYSRLVAIINIGLNGSIWTKYPLFVNKKLRTLIYDAINSCPKQALTTAEKDDTPLVILTSKVIENIPNEWYVEYEITNHQLSIRIYGHKKTFFNRDLLATISYSTQKPYFSLHYVKASSVQQDIIHGSLISTQHLTCFV